MLEHLKQNRQLYIIFAVWVITGVLPGFLVYAVLPFSLIIMKQKGYYQELILGFFFILVLSDNLSDSLKFVSNVKYIYIVLLTLFLFIDTKIFYPLNTLYKLFIPFFIFSFFCLLYSPALLTGLEKTLSYIFVLMVVPNYFVKCYREKGDEFIKNIIYLGTFLLLFGFLLAFISKESAFVDEGRYRGIFGNPNGLGLFTFVFITFFFVLNYQFTNLFSKQEKIFIYGVSLLSVLLSQSRNALMGVLILFALSFFFKKNIYLGLISTIVIAFLSYIITDKIPLIIQSLGLENFLRLKTLQELSGRAVAWEFAWRQIQQNFFIGKGFGFDEYIMRLNMKELSKLGHQGGVHNSYLSIWLNFGFIGLLVYLRSFFLIFIKASNYSKLAFPILFAVLFSATFEGLLVGSLNPHMFLLLSSITIIFEPELFSEKNPTELNLVLEK